MAIEIVDDKELRVYRDLFTDGNDLTWNILIRPDGSISLYSTHGNVSAHGVVFDTLDLPENRTAKKVIDHLKDMAEGINALLAVYGVREREAA